MYTRSDRKLTELRKIVAEVGVIKDAAGSARFAFGNTEIYCAVDGPKEVLPKHLEDPEKAIIKFKYDMLPFSTAERTKPGLNRRDIEISEVVKMIRKLGIEEDVKKIIKGYLEEALFAIEHLGSGDPKAELIKMVNGLVERQQ